MELDLSKVKNQVYAGLRDHPETRDCDKLMFLYVMVKHYGMRDAMGKEAYMRFRAWFIDSDTPSMESVRRCRQKWQEEGHFEGTKRSKRMAEVPGTVEFIRDFGEMS